MCVFHIYIFTHYRTLYSVRDYNTFCSHLQFSGNIFYTPRKQIFPLLSANEHSKMDKMSDSVKYFGANAVTIPVPKYSLYYCL